MAHIYLTTLEEIHRQYPNLQLESGDGIQYIMQDDQVTQYIDAQGKQVITTVEQSGVQFSSQNATVSPQQPLYLIETIEGQPTDSTSTQSIPSSSQQHGHQEPTQIVVQQVDHGNQTTRQIITSPPHFVLQTLDGTCSESFAAQQISTEDGKPQYVVQMDPIKQQNVPQQHFVIQPSDLVQIEQSKHHVTQQQGQYIVQAMESNRENTQNVKQQLESKIKGTQYAVRPNEANKPGIQPQFVGNVQASKQQYNMQHLEATKPNQQQLDKPKQNQQQMAMHGNKQQQKFIMQLSDSSKGNQKLTSQQPDSKKQVQRQQHLSQPNQQQQQYAMQQMEANKNQSEMVIRQLDANKQNPQQCTMQNVEGNKQNQQQLMMQLEANKQSQQFLAQHMEGNKQQQFIVETNKQGQQQLVMHQIDVSKQNQPTSQFQYIIQQTPMQYVEGRHQSSQKEDGGTQTQYENQRVCLIPQTVIGSDKMQQQQQQHFVVKQNTGQQFISQMPVQVQHVLHQPAQVHSQMQTVEMGSNVMLIQKPGQIQDSMFQNKRQELIQQQQKQQQMMTQRQQMPQQNETQHLIQQQQMLQNRTQIQGVNQQQQTLQHPQQHMMQQSQFSNQVTVLDTFSQPNVTIEHRSNSDEKTEQQQMQQQHMQQQQPLQPQQQQQQQQVQQQHLQQQTTQQQHLQQHQSPQPQQSQQFNLPQQQQQQQGNKHINAVSNINQQSQSGFQQQRFTMMSPPLQNARMPQPRKKSPRGPAPDTPVRSVQTIVRQQQPRMRFPSPQQNLPINKQEMTDSEISFQQNDPSPQQPRVIVESMVSQNVIRQNISSLQIQQPQQMQIHHQQQQQSPSASPIPQCEIVQQQKMQALSGVQTQTPRFPQPGNQIRGQQPFNQMNRPRFPQQNMTRPQVVRSKTVEQQTDAMLTINENRDVQSQQFERVITSQQSLNQSPVSSRGRGGRGRGQSNPFPRGVQQYSPRGRGGHMQTMSPRMPNAERGKRPRAPRGGRGGRGGWVPGGPELGQQTQTRPGLPQTPQQVPCNGEVSQPPVENLEGAQMMVLLPNGGRKWLTISTHASMEQLLQQVLPLGSQENLITTEQPLESTSSGHMIMKNNLQQQQQVQLQQLQQEQQQQPQLQQQQPGTPQHCNLQVAGGFVKTGMMNIQPRVRAMAPRMQQSGPNLLVGRPRAQFIGQRMNSPRAISPRLAGPPSLQAANVASQTTALGPQPEQTPAGVQPAPPAEQVPPAPPSKENLFEESKFVSGKVAICPYCGISSLDFNKCVRCHRKLPENVKSASIFVDPKAKPQKSIAATDGNSEGSKSDADDKSSDSSGIDGKDNKSLGSDRKKPRPSPKKKKIAEEPAEILILSSDDDEEESKVKKTEVHQPLTAVLNKEPILTPSQMTSEAMTGTTKGSSLTEDLMTDLQPGLYTTLNVRTVRIGSYKAQPKDRVVISTRGIKLEIPSTKDDVLTTLSINIEDILKALIHFGKQIPVLFLYGLPKMGDSVRKKLSMDNKTGPYYDPASSDETHKRITLLLEKMTEENKIALSNIFTDRKMLEELTEKEANDILVRASPLEVQNMVLNNKPMDTVRKIMVYPPPPEKGGITLNNQDYACLGEDQFLNDVIIDFYLKYLMLRILSPEDRNRTHVFSTFFYKRLTTKPKTLRKNDPENDPKLSPAEKRHMRVKGWTKQVNLFEKDFIIVPINEHSHWFLAIICFPGLTGPVKFADNTPVESENTPKKAPIQIGNTTITHIVKTEGTPVNLDVDSGSDRDEAEGDQDDLHPSSDDEGSEQAEEEPAAAPPPVQIPLLAPQPSLTPPPKVTRSSKMPKEPIKQPCILIFDSLAGASRVRVVATLRDYLKIEYKKKMGHERNFSKDTIRGAIPKVPQQNNFTDCGLYVLQYVESFFQDPVCDFKLPLKLQDWFPEEQVSCKRQNLAEIIRRLMEEQGVNVDEMGLPILTFANGCHIGEEDSSRMEDDEEEEDEEDDDDDEEMSEEMIRRRIEMEGYDNDEEEDMDLGEEDDEEELEEGEIRRSHVRHHHHHLPANVDLDSSYEQAEGPTIVSKVRLCDYDTSGSDYDENQLLQEQEVSKDHDEECTGAEQASFPERRKNVPLAELQDFESQISCSTIDKSLVDSRTCEAAMLISEEDEEDEGDVEIPQEMRKNLQLLGMKQIIIPLERKTLFPNQKVQKTLKDQKAREVTDMLEKLQDKKTITVCRKEGSKKPMPNKQIKVKDCDKIEELRRSSLANTSNSNVSPNPNKRPNTNQDLKSVRILKKGERKSEVANKRPKIDER